MGMKGYKGFRKGLICKDKQYAENTIFEESEANICVNGMHFCKNPMDVLDYYPLIDNNGEMCEFSEVEAMDETLTNDEKKYCTKKLKIGARLSLVEFIKASFDVTYRQIKEEVDNVSEKENVVDNATLAGGNGAKLAGGNGAKLAGGDGATLAGGDNAKLAGGNRAKLAGGDNAKLAGGYGAKLAGGDNAKLAGGNWAALAGGNWAKLAGGYGATLAGGYGAKLAGGNWATLAGGDNATLAGGKHSIMVSENGGRAKGGMGSVIVMVERNGKGEIVNYKAIQIDGDTYKEDTWYRLEDGEIKEVE
nr:MAG TPA: hypothetical protein [Caudoviricetes sp.]